MALSEDQRALLRLLLSGDTYGQVADVLGIGADQVRTIVLTAWTDRCASGLMKEKSVSVDNSFWSRHNFPLISPGNS